MVQLNRGYLLIGIFSLVLSQAHAEIMFEGYSQIKSGETPIGYTIQRYEFNAAKKQFTSTSFLKTNSTGNSLTESTKAVANESFQPVSFQYTGNVGGTLKTIDAKFAKDTMTATVTENGKTKTIKVPVKKGTFLSTFLGYLMLQQGYKVDKNFSYSAIAEEDGSAYSGQALIKSEEDYKGQKVFKILNNFKGSEFVSFVNAKGEVLGTSSPLQDISTELMANSAEATKGMVLPTDVLKTLFGSVPTGKVNSLASKTVPTLPVTAPPPAKTSPPTPAPAAQPIQQKEVLIKPPPPTPPSPSEPNLPADGSGPKMKLYQPKKSP